MQLSLLLFLGCQPVECPVGFVADQDTCAFSEARIRKLVQHMDAGDLVRVNREPYMPPYSAWPILRNSWVSPVPVPGENYTADALFKSIDQDNWADPLEADFPVGTVIIHEAVNREESHGVAVKRDDYTDEMGRNWWLRMINDDGTLDDTPRQPCADCHNDAYRPSEGLWGVPSDAK